VSNPEDVDESKGIYPSNLDYKTDAWQTEHSSAFFHYILENAEKTPTSCGEEVHFMESFWLRNAIPFLSDF